EIHSNKLAFNPPPAKEGATTPSTEARMVGAPTVIDWLWRYRYSTPPGVNTAALMPIGLFRLEQPGALFQALQEVRRGINEQPDNPLARARLAVTYDQIYDLESQAADIGLDKRFQAEQKRVKLLEEETKKKGADKKGAAELKAPTKTDKDVK